jgi:hypothetical protein
MIMIITPIKLSLQFLEDHDGDKHNAHQML